MNLYQLKPHPYSQIFPNESGDKFNELVVSIKKIGKIRFPIIVYQDMILDGNQRLRACKIAKVEPRHIEFKGTNIEALDMVWDLNWNRRQLNVSQKAFFFAQYCAFADTGRPEKGSHVTPLLEAATKAGVSEKTMQRAKKVVEQGTNEQKESIRSGDATVTEIASEIAAKKNKKGVNGTTDDMGFSVPLAAMPYWSRKVEAEQILATLRAAKKKINALNKNDVMWVEVNLGGVLGDLDSAINRFRGAVPAHVCHECEGKRPKGCKACHSRGVVSEFFWRHAVPAEARKEREKHVSGS